MRCICAVFDGFRPSIVSTTSPPLRPSVESFGTLITSTPSVAPKYWRQVGVERHQLQCSRSDEMNTRNGASTAHRRAHPHAGSIDLRIRSIGIACGLAGPPEPAVTAEA